MELTCIQGVENDELAAQDAMGQNTGGDDEDPNRSGKGAKMGGAGGRTTLMHLASMQNLPGRRGYGFSGQPGYI
jgi:hypothetical protein